MDDMDKPATRTHTQRLRGVSIEIIPTNNFDNGIPCDGVFRELNMAKRGTWQRH